MKKIKIGIDEFKSFQELVSYIKENVKEFEDQETINLFGDELPEELKLTNDYEYSVTSCVIDDKFINAVSSKDFKKLYYIIYQNMEDGSIIDDLSIKFI